MFTIRPADFPPDNDSVLAIFREYIASAPVSLDYQRMCLDVLADFETARRLYVRLGFEPCDPVSFNPIPGTHFLGRNL